MSRTKRMVLVLIAVFTLAMSQVACGTPGDNSFISAGQAANKALQGAGAVGE